MNKDFCLTTECYSIALYIIEQTNKYNEGKNFGEQKYLTCSRLVRLLYFCDILHMIMNNGEPMFDDDFAAWSKGPSIPQIYDIFILENLTLIPQQIIPITKLTEENKNIINQILDVTKNLETEELENISKDEPYWHFLDSDYHMEIIPKIEIYNFYLNRKNLIEKIKKENNNVKKLSKQL